MVVQDCREFNSVFARQERRMDSMVHLRVTGHVVGWKQEDHRALKAVLHFETPFIERGTRHK